MMCSSVIDSVLPIMQYTHNQSPSFAVEIHKVFSLQCLTYLISAFSADFNLVDNR